jgi:hypothetical protein
MGQKADDHQAISLCAVCHRTGPNAFHRIGKRAWEALYGPQREHAERTRAILHETDLSPLVLSYTKLTWPSDEKILADLRNLDKSK